MSAELEVQVTKAKSEVYLLFKLVNQIEKPAERAEVQTYLDRVWKDLENLQNSLVRN